ncbi:serine hydrolase [Nitzschia inconspicua]|uniref:Serine hydrolase n=1 Tax=Nitzschia inconspicua TaxID=303405 RepID=A0A9K3KM39_9STRA|nr:serine hydrolase [Nitzschia inconspicua]
MLHGWAQNVHVFSNRSRKLVKRLTRAGYRVVFLQAPHRLPPKQVSAKELEEEEEEEKENESSSHIHQNQTTASSSSSRKYAYGWFLYNKDDPAGDSNPLPSLTGDYHGMNESLEYLQLELLRLVTDNEEPTNSLPLFLLGFSQGAVLVHKVVATLVCHQAERQQTQQESDTNATQPRPPITNPWSRISKCVLVSGFPFQQMSVHGNNNNDMDDRSVAHTKTIPSLHVVGTQDSRVAPYLTRQVYEQEPCFRGKCVQWEHPKGHVLPTDQAFCEFLIQFLDGPCH